MFTLSPIFKLSFLKNFFGIVTAAEVPTFMIFDIMEIYNQNYD